MRIRSILPDVAAGEAAGSVVVEAAGAGARGLVKHLVESIQQLAIGRDPQVTWEVGEAGEETQGWSEALEAISPAFSAVRPEQPPPAAGELRPVYVSYAWGGDSEALVDEFERRLPADFKLVRDRNEMRPGDWISRLMQEIGRADRVLVVLSDKYLRSVYCMRELLYLCNTSVGDRDRMMKRIVPVVIDDLKCGRARDRHPYVCFWEEEHSTLEAMLRGRKLGSVGDADRAELVAIQEFYLHVADLLAWVGDTLMPQGVDARTRGVDAAIEMLRQRG